VVIHGLAVYKILNLGILSLCNRVVSSYKQDHQGAVRGAYAAISIIFFLYCCRKQVSVVDDVHTQ